MFTQVIALNKLKDSIKDILVKVSEVIGIHPLDLLAIVLLPLLYFSVKKYTKEDYKSTLTDKLFDIPFFIGALIIYIIFFLNLFGVLSYD